MKYLILVLSIFLAPSALASVNLVDKDDWKVDMSGFVETDVIYDSARGFTEKIGNAPVGPTNGQGGQTQFSIRNSRFAFNVQAPTYEDFKSRGYFEFDFLGYDAAPNESSFYNNPTLRVRHAYLSAENGGWQFLTGQTWALMGWQPYYFIPTIQVAPIPGMLYSRTAQIRAMKSLDMSENSTLQLAAGLMRPPQRISSLPALEAGARWALNNWRGAFTGGATGSHAPQPLSVGLSGTVRDIETATDASGATRSMTGYAAAADVLVPVLRSSDGKSTDNNLVIGGEFTIGQGYGDEFDSWTGNQANPLNSGKVVMDQLNSLDAGIAGWENDGYNLIQLQTFNLYAQYHLPARWRTWVSAGYSQLYSSNMGAMAINAGKEPYDQEEAFFANVSHDCTNNIRVGFEWAQIKTTYTASQPAVSYADTAPVDNRMQFSTWFMF